MSTGGDSISFPVTTTLAPGTVEKIVAEVQKKLEAGLTAMTPSAVSGALPGKMTVIGKERFEAGGKQFEMTQRLISDLDDTEAENRIVTTIRELREAKKAGDKVIDTNLLRFKKFKEAIRNQPIDKQIPEIEQFIKNYGDINNELSAKLMKLNDKQTAGIKRELNQKFSDVRSSNVGQSLQDQIKAWQDLGVAVPELQDRANHQIRRLTAQWVDATKKLRRQKFRTFLEGIKGIEDWSKQIEALDVYIAQKGAVFIEDAKAQRAFADRMKKNQEAADRRARQRNFANQVLVGAGAGLGLFGSAGFPLLNVGFAAMSGGVPGTMLVAFTTALGEAVRHIKEISAEAVAVAKEVGFVADSFKEIEARMKGSDIVLGQLNLTAQTIGKERLDTFRLKYGTAGELGPGIEGLGQAGQLAFNEQIVAIKNRGVLSNIGTALQTPFRLLFGTIEEFNSQVSEFDVRKLPDLRSARENFARSMNVLPKIGTDPYQENYLRIQNAAIDLKRQEEERWREMTLKRADAQIAVLEQIEANTNKGTAPPISPFWGGGDAF